MNAKKLSIITKHVWSEPRFRAWVEWQHFYAFVIGGGRMPDFDWWEPRHDQPWRRKAARDRELDELLRRA